MSKKRIDIGDDYKRSSQSGEKQTFSEETSTTEDRVDADTNFLTGRPFSKKYYDILDTRRKLPCWSKKTEFIKTVRTNQVTLLIGETGSGKTTQMPQFLVGTEFSNNGYCIACTQPRRVAAMSVAARVAEEFDIKLGEQVGYTIRFDDCSGSNTKLKYLTDGMLLREAMTDHLLSRYSVILLDEAHERTLATDLLFGLIKAILPQRPDLRVVVMSATLEAQSFCDYFGSSAPLLTVPGRMFPVEINYLEDRADNYLDCAIQTVLQIHETEQPGSGDILLFLTGEEEIDNACTQLSLKGNENARTTGELMVVPLYSSLPPHMQQKIFDRAPNHPGRPAGRKVVVSTNIAETSITIDGVVFVVDPGFSKQKVYNPRTRVESLLVSPISKASAKQRAGRAGRTKPGQCFRLYTDRAFGELQESTHPELLRSNLASVVLTLLRLGVTDLVHFDFMSPPAPETMMRALEQLHYLGAIDDEGELTEMGSLMSDFPLDPLLACALVSSVKFKVVEEVLTIVAMLSVPPVFHRPRDAQKEADFAKSQFASQDGDHLTLLYTFNAYRDFKAACNSTEELHAMCRDNFLNARSLKSAEDIREQLKRNLTKTRLLEGYSGNLSQSSSMYTANVRKALLSSFFLHVAVIDKAQVYTTVVGSNPELVALHPSTVIQHRPQWVMYNEFVLTAKKFIRTVTEVDASWLLEVAPHYFTVDNMAKEAWKKLEKDASVSKKRRLE